MARGKLLNLEIGVDFKDEWNEVTTISSNLISDEIIDINKHFLIFQKVKRRGKVVTLVGEFHRPKDEMMKLLKSLKKSLGCGGSYKNSMIELQGDIKDDVKKLLLREKYKFKN